MIRKCRHNEFVPETTLVGMVSALPTHCSRQKHTMGGSGLFHVCFKLIAMYSILSVFIHNLI